jgi:hypothetical protein
MILLHFTLIWKEIRHPESHLTLTNSFIPHLRLLSTAQAIYIAPNGRKVGENNEMWKEAVVARIQVISGSMS